MSVSIAYGISNLLPYDASYEDKVLFFKNMASQYVMSIYEIIEVRDNFGRDIGEPRLLLANDEAGITEVKPPYEKADSERMDAYTRGRQQIDYNMWGVLQSIQVFVPYYAHDGVWVAVIEPMGELNMASLSYGIDVATMMIEEAEDADERETWKQVLETFKGAEDHEFFVMITD